MKLPYGQKIFLIAIVFVKNNTGYDCKKYQYNITTKNQGKFCNDMRRKFSAAEYINFYYKKTSKFLERIYL